MSTSRMEITGLKRFKGVIDGKEINSGAVFVRIKLDDTRNNLDSVKKGECTEELRVDPAIIKAVEHNTFPLLCEVETERVSNGRESREVVIAIRPIDLAPAATAKPLKAA